MNPDEPRRGWRRWLAPPPAAAADDESLKPSTMRGNEAMWGYAVAAELILVSILNLTVTHGAGAPKHPDTALSVIGLLASIALVPIIRTNHRFIVPLAAIVAAFFVTLPSQVPNTVRTAHILALIVPVIYAFVLTQRQRRAATALAKAGRSSPAKSAGTRTEPAKRGTDTRSRSRGPGRKKAGAQVGPTASSRYTPPKPKRPRPQPQPAGEPADQRRKWWGRPGEN